MLEPQDFPITEFPRNTGEGMEEYSRKCQLAQFVTRHVHWKGKTTQNEQQHAGHPMVYHCVHCGMPSDILPEDFMCRPRTVCSMCQPLVELNLIDQAKKAALQEQIQS